jgi:hypothetical protein
MEGTIVHSTTSAAAETLEFLDINEDIYRQWFFKEIMTNKHGGKASYVNSSASARKSPVWQMPRLGVPWGIRYSEKMEKKDDTVDDDSAADGKADDAVASSGIQPGKKLTCDLDISSNAAVIAKTREIDSHILEVAATNSVKWFNKKFDASKLQMVYREIAPEPSAEGYKILFRTKVPWYPRDTTGPASIGRFAGLLGEDGSIEETNAYLSNGSMIMPDPVGDRESHFYYLVKNASGATEYCDKVPIVKSNGEPLCCARSGRPMYRFLSPFDVKANYEIEPIVELNSLWFTNKQFGCTLHVQHAIVYPTTTSKKPAFKIGGHIVREAARMEDDSDGRKFAMPVPSSIASGGPSGSSGSSAHGSSSSSSSGPSPSDADDF